MSSTVITLPKRNREGSVTPELLADVHKRLTDKDNPLGEREAVVVAAGLDKENTARNRARAVAVEYESKHGTKLSAHAVPDPDASGKFVGAVTVRAERPADAPKRDNRTLDALAASATDKGLTVQGTGRNGKVTRQDYINAGA